MSLFEDSCNEAWLINRLQVHRIAITAGITDQKTRKERIRAAIVELGPMIVCGKDGTKPVTYREAFERLFGEPLVLAAKVRSAGTEFPNAQSAQGELGAIG